jgi:uncharacterized protein (TIGR03435 family)
MIAFVLLFAPAAEPQTAEPKAVFETASIKMVSLKEGGGHSHESGDPGMLRGSMTLKSYIMTAYGVKAFQVTGGPNWIDATTYEIVAKLENPRVPLPEKLTTHERSVSEDERLQLALQTLLSERFQLKFHRDTKQMSAYALTVSKSGFKLKAAPKTNDCGTSSTGNGASRRFTATCIDMAAFASFLARQMRLPVFDQTSVQGVYSFTMEWTPDDLKTADPADQDGLPSLFTVLDKQLGLKLDPKKAPVEIIVVDSAERPSEN